MFVIKLTVGGSTKPIVKDLLLLLQPGNGPWLVKVKVIVPAAKSARDGVYVVFTPGGP